MEEDHRPTVFFYEDRKFRMELLATEPCPSCGRSHDIYVTWNGGTPDRKEEEGDVL